MVYATQEDYLRYYSELPDDFDRLAARASRDIDTVTHCRINGIGWDSLTEFQHEAISEACCDIVHFVDENRDLLDVPLSSYSVNGVSMQFKFNPTIYSSGGTVMPLSTYSRLLSTGLCYAGGMT